jgi:hypothetical protein
MKIKRYLVVHLMVDNYDGGKRNDIGLYHTDDYDIADALADKLVEGTPVDGGYPDLAYVVDTNNLSDEPNSSSFMEDAQAALKKQLAYLDERFE